MLTAEGHARLSVGSQIEFSGQLLSFSFDLMELSSGPWRSQVEEDVLYPHSRGVCWPMQLTKVG
jgi:hypothetical protein